MKWGTPWGKLWGLLEELARRTVEVRIIRGRFYPCRECRWRHKCVIPKSRQFHKNFKKPVVETFYRCEDFESKDN